MCFFSSPKAPQIVYQGPSQADVEANQRSLDQYRQQSMAQQQLFSAALQKQIDDANAEAERQKLQLQEEQARASAEMGAQQQAAYATVTETPPPENAAVTAAPKPKDKNKSTLKIAPGATAMSAGSGLNIGV